MENVTIPTELLDALISRCEDILEAQAGLADLLAKVDAIVDPQRPED